MPSPEDNLLRRTLPEGAEQSPAFEAQEIEEEKPLSSPLDTVLTQSWNKALTSESYEETNSALGELRALRQWRREYSGSKFKDFYSLFEQASLLEKSQLPAAERTALRDELIGRFTPKAHGQSPRVADLYMGLLSEIDGTPYPPQFETTTERITALRESGDLAALLSPNVPFEVKLNRFKTRLEGELMGRRALDKRDRKNQEEGERSPDSSPPTPPPTSEESKPGMDEMERTPEGEPASAIWSISPARGGYYKGRSYDTWNSEKNVWGREKPTYAEVEGLATAPVHEEGELTMQAEVRPGQWTEMNIPYTHSLGGISVDSGRVHVRRDQNGDHIFYVEAAREELIPVSIFLSQKTEYQALTQEGIPIAPDFNSELSPEVLAQIEQIRGRKKGNLARARAVSRLVMQRLKYSNDSSFNSIYESHPGGYIAAIDEHRQADCDVSNTYFAAACAKLNIPVRHVTGHMVKGKDEEGNSRITSGTGHAWSEVWNEEKNEWAQVGKEWIRIDATPPGDPQLDEDEKPKGEGIPGDYGSQEAIGPTDEQLRALEEKLAGLAEELQYTPEERQLAEATGIEMKEARDIVKEIAQAEETKLPNGERIVDVLSRVFSLIIESRRTSASEYTGPLRKREGGEYIDDIVAHKIGILAGETDPVSRQKEINITKPEQVFGGFDLYLLGDKSGSMGQTVDGEEKWRLQRRAQYLILSSLYRFERNLKAAGVHMADPLSVRTQAISFRGEDEIDVDKPLSNTFSPEDKVMLWRSLGDQGVGNGDVAGLTMIHGQISEERRIAEEQKKVDDRLRVVIACSDGYPDDVAGVHRYAEALGRLNSVVVGVGLTETAAQVPLIFDTPFSKGDIAKDINDLPVIVARHVVEAAFKLFPERSRNDLMPYLETVVHKFSSLG